MPHKRLHQKQENGFMKKVAPGDITKPFPPKGTRLLELRRQTALREMKRRKGGVQAIGPALIFDAQFHANLAEAATIEVKLGKHHRLLTSREQTMILTGRAAVTVWGIAGMIEPKEMAEFMQHDRGQIGFSFAKSKEMLEIDFDDRRIIFGQGPARGRAIAGQGDSAAGMYPFFLLVNDYRPGKSFPLDDRPTADFGRTGGITDPDETRGSIIENLFAPTFLGKAVPHVHGVHERKGLLDAEIPLFQSNRNRKLVPSPRQPPPREESRRALLDNSLNPRGRGIPSCA